MNTVLANKYEILRKLGQGGMGTVYKVRHTTLDTVFALKTLPDHLADNPDLVARFQREARVMAQLRHDHIVRVFDFARDANLYYLLQEFIEGQNLSEHLRARGALPVAHALEIALQLARALAYAHERGVIHRDIKPSNVMIEEREPVRALLTDFGIAKVEDASERTQTGMLLGSLKYAAPEQMGYRGPGRGKSRERIEIDGRADVYALGLVIYEMCEGEAFFAGLEQHEIIGRVLYEPEPLLPEFSRPVPADAVRLVAKAISRDPAERYQTMAEFVRDIDACLAGLDRGAAAPVVPGSEARGFDPGADSPTVAVTALRELSPDETSDEELDKRIRALEIERLRRLALTAQTQVRAARERATAAGAAELAPDAMAAAVAQDEAGGGALAEGQYGPARERFDEAARGFADAARAAAEAGARAASAAREDARAARTEAEAARAAAAAPGAWTAATAREADAVAALDRGAAVEARRAFADAAALFRDAQRAAERAALERAAADARAAMDEARAAATAAGAERRAAASFGAAERDEAAGRAALGGDDLARAVDRFTRARDAFARAASEAARALAGERAEEARQAARRSEEAARHAGAEQLADWMYEEAFRALEAADRRLAGGEPEPAAEAFVAAARLFERAAAEAERRRQAAEAAERERRQAEARARAERLRQEVLKARSAAEEAEAAARAAGAAEAASVHAEAAGAAAAAGRLLAADEDEEALQAFQRATALFRRAASEAEEARRREETRRQEEERRRAEEAQARQAARHRAALEARAEAQRARAAATEAEAPRHAAAAWAHAEQADAAAARALGAGEDEEAGTGFTRAAALFRDAAAAAEAQAQAERRARAEAEPPANDDEATRVGIDLAEATRVLPPAREAPRHAGEAAAEDRTRVLPAPPVAPRAEPPAAVPRAAGRWLGLAAAAVVVAALAAWWATRPAPPAPAPALAWDAVAPTAEAPRVREGERLAFSARATAAGGEAEIVWRLDGEERARGATWAYAPGFDEGGRTRQVEVVARAGDASIAHAWRVQVDDVNRAPAIRGAAPAEDEVALAAGAERTFSVEAADEDAGDALVYTWERNGRVVATGPESTWTLRDPDERDADLRVTVTDRAGAASPARSWRLRIAPGMPSAVAKAEAPSPNRPPRIVAQTPPPGRQLALAEGKSLDFTVRADDPDADARLTYSWVLDGREVGRGSTWRFTPSLAAAGSETRRIEVEVADQHGLAAPRVGWNVEVTPTPPVITTFQPRTGEVAVETGTAQEFAVTARAATERGEVRHEWSVDGGAPQRRGDGRFQLPATLAPGRHVIEVVAVDGRGLRSRPQRWSVEVKAAAPASVATAAAPPSPPPSAPTASALTEAEVRGWIASFQAAWERKDVGRLQALGVVASDQQAERLRKALEPYGEYRVSIRNEKIELDGRHATVSFERTDSDETGRTLPVQRQTYRLQKGPSGVTAMKRD